MDADRMLASVRRAVERAYLAPEPQSAEGQRVMRHLVALADYVRALDSYLSQGGTPPEAWTEGPDVPGEHIHVPEPLGPPNPAGIELPALWGDHAGGPAVEAARVAARRGGGQ